MLPVCWWRLCDPLHCSVDVFLIRPLTQFRSINQSTNDNTHKGHHNRKYRPIFAVHKLCNCANKLRLVVSNFYFFKIYIPLGMEVGLGPGEFVLTGTQLRSKKGQSPQIFGPCLLWPYGRIDMIGTFWPIWTNSQQNCTLWVRMSITSIVLRWFSQCVKVTMRQIDIQDYNGNTAYAL